MMPLAIVMAWPWFRWLPRPVLTRARTGRGTRQAGAEVSPGAGASPSAPLAAPPAAVPGPAYVTADPRDESPSATGSTGPGGHLDPVHHRPRPGTHAGGGTLPRRPGPLP
ncbi:hypothetical protein D9753_16410 [Streptomyces dangxiongensis]|uniref:Uncharacterized protein n=1 Tax=Streptomyces dangxiongensis TaxID=1442032 RepID=A0A3G2JD23_9ACTN|nr:hypothetical protein [Streptomyces dangxiongensis]AYN40233.1 hypothetical protein D9753_16410 [Streptomyces dangxiongensis]